MGQIFGEHSWRLRINHGGISLSRSMFLWRKTNHNVWINNNNNVNAVFPQSKYPYLIIKTKYYSLYSIEKGDSKISTHKIYASIFFFFGFIALKHGALQSVEFTRHCLLSATIYAEISLFVTVMTLSDYDQSKFISKLILSRINFNTKFHCQKFDSHFDL